MGERPRLDGSGVEDPHRQAPGHAAPHPPLAGEIRIQNLPQDPADSWRPWAGAAGRRICCGWRRQGWGGEVPVWWERPPRAPGLQAGQGSEPACKGLSWWHPPPGGALRKCPGGVLEPRFARLPPSRWDLHYHLIKKHSKKNKKRCCCPSEGEGALELVMCGNQPRHPGRYVCAFLPRAALPT